MPFLSGAMRGTENGGFRIRRLRDKEIFALAPHPGAGQCCVYIWRHAYSPQELEALLREAFPPAAVTDAPPCGQSEKRRAERLSLLLLAKTLFGGAAAIAHTPAGMPLLTGCGGKEPRISVSHSGGLYALSVADRPHGTDIERHSPRAYRVRGKFLSPDEEALLNRAEEAGLTREQAATLFWSAKEAVYKCAGGGAETLGDIRLTQFAPHTLHAVTPADGAAYRIAAENGGGGILAVCTRA